MVRFGPSADIFMPENLLQEEKASNKTEEAKKEKSEEKKPSKPVTVREPLEIGLQWVDVADTAEDAVAASVEKYDKFPFVIHRNLPQS